MRTGNFYTGVCTTDGLRHSVGRLRRLRPGKRTLLALAVTEPALSGQLFAFLRREQVAGTTPSQAASWLSGTRWTSSGYSC